MSLLPLMLREFEMMSEQMFRSMAIPRPMYRFIELEPRCKEAEKSAGTIKAADTITDTDKNGFQVTMNVQDFAPDEISVKTVDDTIVIEGKHEERQDEHGFITRHFTRRYTLPTDYNIKDVVSQLSSDGILIVKAPKLVKAVEDANIRVIQIQKTGPAKAENETSNSKETTEK